MACLLSVPWPLFRWLDLDPALNLDLALPRLSLDLSSGARPDHKCILAGVAEASPAEAQPVVALLAVASEEPQRQELGGGRQKQGEVEEEVAAAPAQVVAGQE